MRTSQDKDELEIAHLDHLDASPADHFTDDEQKSIIRCVDQRIVTMCSLTACVSLMDRTNISSASIAGMNEDLKLNEGSLYSIAVLVLFITYVVGQVPATAIVRKFGARGFLSSLVLF